MIADDICEKIDKLLKGFPEVYMEDTIDATRLDLIPMICYFLVMVRSEVVSDESREVERMDVLIHNFWLKLLKFKKNPWNNEYEDFGLDKIEAFLHKLVINPFRWGMHQRWRQ